MTSSSDTATASYCATRNRILVVDDHPINVKLVLALLAHAGYEAVAATNGAEAIARAAEGGIALVLMDVHMPGMDGYEATRQIRALGGSIGEVPVLALTADMPDEAESEARNAGMMGVCAKPIRAPELLKAISAYAKAR